MAADHEERKQLAVWKTRVANAKTNRKILLAQDSMNHLLLQHESQNRKGKNRVSKTTLSEQLKRLLAAIGDLFALLTRLELVAFESSSGKGM